MRGKHRQGRREAFQGRIIPAHAGQTECGTRARGRRTDHPRACGANLSGDGSDTLGDGSSPRMRGKRCHILHGGWYMRIIPAHAGQTTRVRYGRQAASDHPRACGANPCLVNVVSDCAGSSPRMRGKPLLGKRRVGLHRIIPAHAGQTGNANMPHGKPTDHPRACGANYGRTGISGYDYGSSPRMQGKLVVMQ